MDLGKMTITELIELLNEVAREIECRVMEMC